MGRSKKSVSSERKSIVPLPDCIPVGAHFILIKRPKITDEDIYGYFEDTCDGLVINVDARLDGTHELATFLHETLHAIDDTYGLNLTHNQIEGTAQGLTQSLSFWLEDLQKKGGR